MRFSKPSIPTVYVSFIDGKTRKSRTTTVYNMTVEKALAEFRRAFGGEADGSEDSDKSVFPGDSSSEPVRA